MEISARQFLKDNLSKMSAINAVELDLLISHFELVEFRKNNSIKPGDENYNFYYFVYKGIARKYFKRNNKIIIDRFISESGFFGANIFDIINLPAVYTYDFLEDVILLRIQPSVLEQLSSQYHSIEHLNRIQRELAHANYVESIYAFSALTSEERYYKFISNFGDIAQRIPLNQIANYLGMTSETLSRIRAKCSR